MRASIPALPRAAAALAPVAALLVCGGCGGSDAQAGGRPRNLLLLTIDTLRADHLGCYGYERPTSPAIDALAEQGVVFERAWSSSSWTLPAIASIMTSTYSATHGCWDDEAALAQSFETLAESLASAGFRTGAIVNHIYLDARYGLAQGFGEYDQELVLATARRSHEAVTSEVVSDKAVAWLSARAAAPGRPWFLWVHYFDPHERYMAHEGITERYVRRSAWGPSYADIDLYDGEIQYTDRQLGRVLDALEELGLADETAVMLVADHGEEFAEHGGSGHRQTLYRETVQVPLVLRVAGLEPVRVSERVSALDVLPTALDLLGVERNADAQGRSLLPLVLGGVAEPGREHLAELLFNKSLLSSLQRDRWRLIHDQRSDRRELYDVEADPAEQVDLAARESEVARELLEALARARARAARLRESHDEPAEVELDDADRRRIRDLGYAGEDD